MSETNEIETCPSLEYPCPACAAAERHTNDCSILASAIANFADYSNEEIAIDDDAQLSIGNDGVWVQAWVFIPNEETDHEPHGLLCKTCGIDLNNQCLNDGCRQDNDHRAADIYCSEHIPREVNNE